MKMKLVNRILNLLLVVVVSIEANAAEIPNDNEYPIGFGQYATGGGINGTVYHVNDFKQLKKAFKNNGYPNEPKIIYIDSPINGHILNDGGMVTEEYLAPGYSFEKYINCFNEDGSEWTGTEECENLLSLRETGVNALKNLVKIKPTPNTTLIGRGMETLIEEFSIQIIDVDNVILKNLAIQAPNDIFPQWDPKDGWNSQYDAIVIRGATNVWVDNCLIGDGKKPFTDAPVIFGEHVERHDGLIDIVNGADYVTISNCRFENHKKSILIGNSDSKYSDRGHLHVTIYNNVFINCWQRIPRARFGQIHVFNNYVNIIDDGTSKYNIKYLVLGFESDILSEYNSFNFDKKANTKNNKNFAVVESYGGFIFHDNGSTYNNELINLDEIAKSTFEEYYSRRIGSSYWDNVSFTSDTFDPFNFYNYTLTKDINKVNSLQYKVPTWMFNDVIDMEYNVKLNVESTLSNESINNVTTATYEEIEENEEIMTSDRIEPTEEITPSVVTISDESTTEEITPSVLSINDESTTEEITPSVLSINDESTTEEITSTAVTTINDDILVEDITEVVYDEENSD